MSPYEKAWQAVHRRIADAALRAGRAPDSVRLVAVSKTFPADAVRALHGLGQRRFGENYVAEGLEKKALLADLADIEWRLIGPLQSNKAARAARGFDAVETIDRLDLAARLSAARAAIAGAAPLDVLVQVNISGEATKHGVAADAAVALARDVSTLPALRLRGFMGIGAAGVDERALRQSFRRLRRCHDDARAGGLAVDTLSMGMSDDFEAAIAEGATEVRIGSALFGPRSRQVAAPGAASVR